jgi:hypothetical protein
VPLEKLPVEKQICKIFGKDCKMALAISQAENGSRKCDRVSKPNKNGSLDIGVFQINYNAHQNKGTLKDLMDCTTNIKIAKQIFDASGWNAWSVYKSGLYKKYL